jgi:hypothetical protein
LWGTGFLGVLGRFFEGLREREREREKERERERERLREKPM